MGKGIHFPSSPRFSVAAVRVPYTWWSGGPPSLGTSRGQSLHCLFQLLVAGPLLSLPPTPDTSLPPLSLCQISRCLLLIKIRGVGGRTRWAIRKSPISDASDTCLRRPLSCHLRWQSQVPDTRTVMSSRRHFFTHHTPRDVPSHFRLCHRIL